MQQSYLAPLQAYDVGCKSSSSLGQKAGPLGLKVTSCSLPQSTLPAGMLYGPDQWTMLLLLLHRQRTRQEKAAGDSCSLKSCAGNNNCLAVLITYC